MANATTVQILEDGPQSTVCVFNGTLDTSDLALTTVLDPAVQYIDPVNPTTQYRIDEIQWAIDDPVTVRLFWDASTDVLALNMAGRGRFCIGDSYGGFQNNAGAGKTGKILADTKDYTSGSLSFTIIIHATKQ